MIVIAVVAINIRQGMAVLLRQVTVDAAAGTVKGAIAPATRDNRPLNQDPVQTLNPKPLNP